MCFSLPKKGLMRSMETEHILGKRSDIADVADAFCNLQSAGSQVLQQREWMQNRVPHRSGDLTQLSASCVEVLLELLLCSGQLGQLVLGNSDLFAAHDELVLEVFGPPAYSVLQSSAGSHVTETLRATALQWQVVKFGNWKGQGGTN